MDVSAPTTGASEAESTAWAARPLVAYALRGLAFALPIATSWFVTRVTSPVFWRPAGWLGLAAWVAQLMTVGSSTVVVTSRLSQRVLPLAALYSLTVAFPDRAPSRFRVALRSGNVRTMQARFADLRANGFGDDRAETMTRIIEMVGALSRHEPRTRGHTDRVRAFSDLIAEEIGINATEREKLRWASMLHDIGKLAVPAEILNKQGRPTDDEWAILVTHPVIGGEIVEPLAGWLGEWRFAASQHHERWDGTGYPNRLAGEQISLAGRILAVADAYDVITSSRSYKKAMSSAAARKELVRCAGSQFDPAIVRAFLNVSIGHTSARAGMVGWLLEVPRGLSAVAGQAGSAAGSVVVASSIAATAAIATAPSLALPSEPAAYLSIPEPVVAAPAPPAVAGARVGDGDGSGNGPPGGPRTYRISPTTTADAVAAGAPSATTATTTTTTTTPTGTNTGPSPAPVPTTTTPAAAPQEPATSIPTTPTTVPTTVPTATIAGGTLSSPTFRAGWTATVEVTVRDERGRAVASASVTVLVEGLNAAGQVKFSTTVVASTDEHGSATIVSSGTQANLRSARFTLTGLAADPLSWDGVRPQIGS